MVVDVHLIQLDHQLCEAFIFLSQEIEFLLLEHIPCSEHAHPLLEGIQIDETTLSQCFFIEVLHKYL